MKKKNNTKYKTMAQSLNEEVVDTIMFQEWCYEFSDTSMKTLMDCPKLNEQPFKIVFGC